MNARSALQRVNHIEHQSLFAKEIGFFAGHDRWALRYAAPIKRHHLPGDINKGLPPRPQAHLQSLHLILVAQSDALAQRCEQREASITLPVLVSFRQPHGAKRRPCPIFRGRYGRMGQNLHITRDQPCVKRASHEILVLQKRYQKITIGLETRDLSQFQTPHQPLKRASPIWTRRNELCDHRIVIGRDLPTLRHAGFHTQARSKIQMMQLAD